METKLEALRVKVQELEVKAAYSEKNRVSLLLIHGLIGTFVGTSIFLDGGPTVFSILNLDPINQVMLGVAPLLGGLLLLTGLIRHRHLLLESIGMTFLLIWDVWMVIGFVVVYFRTNTTVIYPVSIYTGLAAFMVVHLRTLYRFLMYGGR